MNRRADGRLSIDSARQPPVLTPTAQLGLLIVLIAFVVFVFIRVR